MLMEMWVSSWEKGSDAGTVADVMETLKMLCRGEWHEQSAV